MTYDAHESRAVDLAVGKQVRAELLAQGVVSYPAVCQCCHGTGKTLLGKCDNCGGKGSYELAI
jgi:DnaJ-class molecular chaperone